jgi:hypothetical protein
MELELASPRWRYTNRKRCMASAEQVCVEIAVVCGRDSDYRHNQLRGELCLAVQPVASLCSIPHIKKT